MVIKSSTLRMRRWRATHPESKARNAARTAASSRELRVAALAAYGPICVCCGEDNIAFLTFDHIHGGGSIHRKEGKHVTRGLYLELKRTGYPKGVVQVMCFNCNCARSLRSDGTCPHKIIE